MNTNYMYNIYCNLIYTTNDKVNISILLFSLLNKIWQIREFQLIIITKNVLQLIL